MTKGLGLEVKELTRGVFVLDYGNHRHYEGNYLRAGEPADD